MDARKEWAKMLMMIGQEVDWKPPACWPFWLRQLNGAHELKLACNRVSLVTPDVFVWREIVGLS